MSFVDFKEISKVASLDAVASWLNLELKTHGNGQMRCACPVHGGGDRALVLTPSKGLSACHASSFKRTGKKNWGDIIWLTAHVHQIEEHAAALELQKHFRPTSVKPRTVKKAARRKAAASKPWWKRLAISLRMI
jgi:hypothetical protein